MNYFSLKRINTNYSFFYSTNFKFHDLVTWSNTIKNMIESPYQDNVILSTTRNVSDFILYNSNNYMCLNLVNLNNSFLYDFSKQKTVICYLDPYYYFVKRQIEGIENISYKTISNYKFFNTIDPISTKDINSL